jgi:hypothetical protein
VTPVDQKGRHYEGDESRSDAAVASAARTASGTGAEFNTEDAQAFEATLAITASSGTTPTLDVRLETTVDGTTWYTVGSFSQKTGNGSDAKAFGPLGDKCRWAWTIAGTTPSFTFSIAVEAQREH